MSLRNRELVEVARLRVGDRIERYDGKPGGEYLVELISGPFDKLDLFRRTMVGFQARIVLGPDRIGVEGEICLGPEGRVWRACGGIPLDFDLVWSGSSSQGEALDVEKTLHHLRRLLEDEEIVRFSCGTRSFADAFSSRLSAEERERVSIVVREEEEKNA